MQLSFYSNSVHLSDRAISKPSYNQEGRFYQGKCLSSSSSLPSQANYHLQTPTAQKWHILKYLSISSYSFHLNSKDAPTKRTTVEAV